jgi:hypothetical protein
LAWLIELRTRVARPRAVLAVAAVLALGASLAACDSQGIGLARQACGDVGRSITLLHEADRTHDSSNATELNHKAYMALMAALPIAASATYVDNQWQALMTTLSQSSEIPETQLVPALQAECRVANNSVFDQSPPPSSIPPPSVGTIPPPSVGATSSP